MDPADILEPKDLGLYLRFDDLAKTIGATDQKRRDALASLLVDFSSDPEYAPEDVENNIVEEGDHRYVRWILAWLASEYSDPGSNPAADKIYEKREELQDLAIPLKEAIALDKGASEEKPARSGRSGGRAGGRSGGRSAATPASDANAENLKDALAGLPDEKETKASDAPSTEGGSRQRRRSTTKEEKAPEEKPARSRRTAAAKEEEEELPSVTEDAVRRIKSEVDSSVPLSTRAFLEIELAVTEHRASLLRKALGDLTD